MNENPLPLSGVRVIEICHMVMGPTCGLVLADLGADVIKIEPPEGDATRRLIHQGAGFFASSNRNKRSLVLDLNNEVALKTAKRLIAGADVLIENLRPGGLQKKGLGYDDLRAENPGLIYCGLKGFLPGPYGHRTALDEVVQMMGGLAYMTGPEGRPLRAGASVTDILGGVYGVVGILAALHERERTGLGQEITSALFETTVHLVGQHMTQYAVTGVEPGPMPDRPRAWAVYDIFQSSENVDIFIGIVTDSQWQAFCEASGKDDWLTDPDFVSNASRHAARARLLPLLQDMFGNMTTNDLMDTCEHIGLPFAPINKPHDLYDDPHLNASGGLGTVTLMDGREAKVPLLPLEMDGRRLGVRRDLPHIGEQSREILLEAGLTSGEIDELINEGAVSQNDEKG